MNRPFNHLKTSILVFTLIIISSQFSFADTYKVKRVIDGDTLELSNGQIVELIGIDAPESSANKRAKLLAKRRGVAIKDIIATGKEAKKFVRKLVEGKEVRLESDLQEKTKDGHWLAYVYDVETYKDITDVVSPVGHEMVGNEVFINATILKSGYASQLPIPPNVKHGVHFKLLYLEAKENKRGLWKGCAGCKKTTKKQKIKR